MGAGLAGFVYLNYARSPDVPYSVFVNEFVLKHNVSKIVIYDNCMVRFYVNTGTPFPRFTPSRSLQPLLREIRSGHAVHVLHRRYLHVHDRSGADAIRTRRVSQSVHQRRVRYLQIRRLQHFRAFLPRFHSLPRQYDDPAGTRRRHGHDVTCHGTRVQNRRNR